MSQRVFREAHGRLLFTSIIGLSVLSWVALWLWARSPYGRYVDHGNWTEIGLAATICEALPAGKFVVPTLLYIGGWLLMLIAMMLPTALPLLEIYRRSIQSSPNRGFLISILACGYLLAWLMFGAIAHLLDSIVFYAVHRVSFLTLNGWIIGAGVFFVAGVFQFTSLKHHCLDRCRTPLSFILQNSGRTDDGASAAFRLGWQHGVFCVGCCWAIMLLMFVVGTANVGYMLIIGAVMALEKNARWGHRLSTPLGVALLAFSLIISLRGFASI